MNKRDRPVTVAETELFTKVAHDCMSKTELEAFKFFIACNPTAGDIIPGTGGVRKVRWGIGNRGKSGGARVIYYFMTPNYPIYLLTAYSKSKKASLTDSQKQDIKRIATAIKRSAQ